MVGVFVAFIRVVYGRMIYMSLPIENMAIDTFIVSFVFLSFLHKICTLLRSDNRVIRDEFQGIVKYFNYICFYPEIEC